MLEFFANTESQNGGLSSWCSSFREPGWKCSEQELGWHPGICLLFIPAFASCSSPHYFSRSGSSLPILCFARDPEWNLNTLFCGSKAESSNLGTLSEPALWRAISYALLILILIEQDQWLRVRLSSNGGLFTEPCYKPRAVWRHDPSFLGYFHIHCSEKLILQDVQSYFLSGQGKSGWQFHKWTDATILLWRKALLWFD